MERLAIIFLNLIVWPTVLCHYHTGYFHEASDPFEAKPDWMAAIPDNTKLCKLSIPGTHDSASHRAAISNHDKTTQGYLETQCMNFDFQLKNGIRAFDIRVINKSGAFQLTHSTWLTTETFTDFLNKCNSFLDKHPKEMLIMRLRADGPTEGVLSDRDVFKRYMTFSEGRRLTLISSFEESIGEHRNKIIVLLDNERLQVPDKMTYWHCNIQDMYDLGTQFELYNKWEKVKAQLIGAPKDNDCNINFLSGNSGGGAVWPYFVASGHISGSTYADRLWTGTVVTDTDTRSPDFPRVQCIKWFIWRLCSVQYEGTNVLTTNFLNDRNNGLSRNYGLGLVFSDYPGTGLISAIIAQNFK